MATQTFYIAGDKKLTAGASTSALVNEFQLERAALNSAFQGVRDEIDTLGGGVHSGLSGLAADDHTQYALSDKSRPATWVEAADLSARAIADLGDVAGTTGTGDVVRETSPTLVTPAIGSFASANHNHESNGAGGTMDHGLALTGLADDDHTQYALLAGRSGGQAITGDTEASGDLALNSTANGTKGNVDVGTDDSTVQLGSASSAIGVLGTSGIVKASAIAARVDSTGGSTAGALVAITAIGGSGATTAQEGEINDNFARMATTLESVRSTMSAYGWY